MVRIQARGLTRRFGDFTAVDGIDLDVAEGEFFSLLGPSGCGKSTTLRMIAGLEEPDAGTIHLGDQRIDNLPVHRRGVGMVFQSYALFPHLTVARNVAFGLRMQRLPRKDVDERVSEALGLVRLEGLEDRLPSELSGGQQQRVALARALATRPKVLLLDEPLSNLDARLRENMRVELRELQMRLGMTTLFVTHDQTEVLALSDRLAVMHQGTVEQVGTPREVYERPATSFVAGFMGESNVWSGKVTETSGQTARVATTGGLALTVPGEGLAVGDEVVVSVRPERVELRGLDADAPARDNAVKVTLAMTEYRGNTVRHIADAGEERIMAVELAASGDESATRALPAGETYLACWDASACGVNADGGV